MSTLGNVGQKMTQYRWTICAMLFFATTVNYLDRQVLSLTWDEFIKPEFHWNESHIFYSFLSFITKNVIKESLLYICRITRTYKKKWSLDDVRSIKNVFFCCSNTIGRRQESRQSSSTGLTAAYRFNCSMSRNITAKGLLSRCFIIRKRVTTCSFKASHIK